MGYPNYYSRRQCYGNLCVFVLIGYDEFEYRIESIYKLLMIGSKYKQDIDNRCFSLLSKWNILNLGGGLDDNYPRE